MTVSNNVVGHALEWFWENAAPPGLTAVQRKARTAWMRQQGIGGIIKNGKQSRSIPDWWIMGTEFWFVTPQHEIDFLTKWK